MFKRGHKVGVLLMEQEENLGHWLGRLLDHTEGFAYLGHCSQVQRLEEEVLRLKPNLLLLDSHSAAALPAGALSRLRQALPDLFVALMDLEEGPSYERLARRAGADGFVSKARVPETLARIRARFQQGAAASTAS